MSVGTSLHSDTGALLLQSGLPRRVLRQLIQTTGIGVGSRVLKAGGRRGELAGFLSSLGMQVWGFNESREEAAAVLESFPDIDARHGDLWDSFPFDEHCFDVVLVRGLSPHRSTLQSSTALRATAQLLSCVRPGGTLAFVQRVDTPALDDNIGHAIHCYEQHLGHFPGIVESVECSDTFTPRSAWQRFRGRPTAAGFITVALRIPDEPLPRFAWLRLADEFGQSDAEACCSWAGQIPADVGGLSKAA